MLTVLVITGDASLLISGRKKDSGGKRCQVNRIALKDTVDVKLASPFKSVSDTCPPEPERNRYSPNGNQSLLCIC